MRPVTEDDLEALMLLDEAAPCETSYHPNHEIKCGAPAQYVFSATDLDCGLIMAYLCPSCTLVILGKASFGNWSSTHRNHRMVIMRLQRTGL